MDIMSSLFGKKVSVFWIFLKKWKIYKMHWKWGRKYDILFVSVMKEKIWKVEFVMEMEKFL